MTIRMQRLFEGQMVQPTGTWLNDDMVGAFACPDGIMSKLGLSGKAFIPMLLGFGCTVPAIMASRALENKRDRFKVMLVTPFMSCNARLTIYILFSEMFFGDNVMLMAYSMLCMAPGFTAAFARPGWLPVR